MLHFFFFNREIFFQVFELQPKTFLRYTVVMFDFLKKLGSSSISLGRDDVVAGIDIGSSSIKVVQLKKNRGVIELETYGELALAPYADKEVGEIGQLEPDVVATAVTDLLREANVTAKKFLFSLQSAASLIFTLELPNVPERQLAQIVPNESRRYIPVPIGEVDLNWQVIPSYTSSEEDIDDNQTQKNIEVLVAALRKETMASYVNIAALAGIMKPTFEMETFGLIRGVMHRELSSTAVVDCGASGTRVAIVQYGMVRDFNTINRGSYMLSRSLSQSLAISFGKAEEMKRTHGLANGTTEHQDVRQILDVGVQYVFSELQKVIVNYEKTHHRAVEKIIFAGGGCRMPGFLEKAREMFEIDMEIADPFSKVSNPEFLDRLLTTTGPEFAVAVGLALKDLQ